MDLPNRIEVFENRFQLIWANNGAEWANLKQYIVSPRGREIELKLKKMQKTIKRASKATVKLQIIQMNRFSAKSYAINRRVTLLKASHCPSGNGFDFVEINLAKNLFDSRLMVEWRFKTERDHFEFSYSEFSWILKEICSFIGFHREVKPTKNAIL